MRTLIHAFALLLACLSASFAQTPADNATSPPRPAASAAAAAAPIWQVQTIETRFIDAQTRARVAVAVHQSVGVPVTHVVLYPSPNGAPDLKVQDGAASLDLNGPWVRTAALLGGKGIALAYADAPSDANAKAPAARAPREVRHDLQAVVKHLASRFPGVPIHVGAFSNAARPLLDALPDLDGVSKAVVVSGGFLDARTSDWPSLKSRVLLIHAPSAQCDNAPYVEAQAVAKRNQFALVSVGYDKQEAGPSCVRGSQHGLTAREQEFVATVADWLNGAPMPEWIGTPNAQIAWREQVHFYTAPAPIGTNQLEMTLLLPQGEGPFPVLVFNDGDPPIDFPQVRYKRRTLSRAFAREFLNLGLAVAVPARRGLSLSEGVYPRNFARNDGDPTYKARMHALDILPALDFLKARPEIDPKRIVLAGQSAGGYSIMFIASQNIPGVIGAIDFAGGRTDMVDGMAPGYLNKMMVGGFEEFGKTAKIPTQWVFAENDSRYSVNTIRASHEAFVKAGGRARLFLNPPLAGDGHTLIGFPDLWRAAVREYLGEIGVLKGMGK